VTGSNSKCRGPCEQVLTQRPLGADLLLSTVTSIGSIAVPRHQHQPINYETRPMRALLQERPCVGLVQFDTDGRRRNQPSAWRCRQFCGFSIRFDLTMGHYKSFRNFWVSELCLPSGILNTRRHNVTETGSVSVFRCWMETSTLLGPSLDNCLRLPLSNNPAE
jgi:hypothetical protein